MNNLYPWLKPVYHQVTQAFQQEYGHHALLFKTEMGLGTEQLILAMAQYLLCESASAPCQYCHSCHLFQAKNHPDFYWLKSIEGKEIGVDQVREVNEKLSQHAGQNGNKVVYIQEANCFSEAAANALLKTLEEPRPNTYFLLQTALSAPLMATIYSRCQAWILNVPPESMSLSWLQEEYQGDVSQIPTALRISHHQPLNALICLQQGWLAKRQMLLAQFWKFYHRQDPLQILPLFEKDLIVHQLDWIYQFLQDSLKAKLAIQHHWVCVDFTKAIQQFAQQHSVQGLLNAEKIWQKVRSDLNQINALNQELILLDGLVGLLLNKELR